MTLTPELLLQAYMEGYFPMADPEEEYAIYWHNPDQRGIIPLDHRFRVSKNLMREYRNCNYDFYINRNFGQVIEACAEGREETWISEEIIESYTQLNKMGFAHSFEVYENSELIGGLYGVSIGKAFFGESMFHRKTNSSKLCLVFLVEFLREHNFLLLDTQYLNPHITQFGAFEIERDQYLQLLKTAVYSDKD